MFVSEEELSIEVTQIDSVEVDNVNVAKTKKDNVFEELAADSAGTNHENSRLQTS